MEICLIERFEELCKEEGLTFQEIVEILEEEYTQDEIAIVLEKFNLEVM